jgi:hypothetical protein
MVTRYTMVYYRRLLGTMVLIDGLQNIVLLVILVSDLVTYPSSPGET